MINGVIVQPLKQIVDERGKVMHMLRCDSPLFTKFGEVYFSRVNYGVVKAWKKHSKMTQNFAVPVGKIRLVICDGKNVDIIETGEDNYTLVKIPPMLWYGFCGLSKEPALIVNCANIPHDPSETEKLDSNDAKIPYVWEKVI